MPDFKHLKEGKINFPFYMTAKDYHDFKLMRGLLNDLMNNNEKVDYEEVGYDNGYHAVFFLFSQKNNKELKKEIDRLKKTFDEI